MRGAKEARCEAAAIEMSRRSAKTLDNIPVPRYRGLDTSTKSCATDDKHQQYDKLTGGEKSKGPWVRRAAPRMEKPIGYP
jgi:hypothetical protein